MTYHTLTWVAGKNNVLVNKVLLLSYVTFRNEIVNIFSGDCLLELLIAKCGCIMYVPADLLKNPSATPICQSFQDLMCLTTVKVDSQYCLTKCKPSCNNWQYSPTISYTKFPSPKLRQWLSEKGWDKNMDDIICVQISFAEMTVSIIVS